MITRSEQSDLLAKLLERQVEAAQQVLAINQQIGQAYLDPSSKRMDSRKATSSEAFQMVVPGPHHTQNSWWGDLKDPTPPIDIQDPSESLREPLLGTGQTVQSSEESLLEKVNGHWVDPSKEFFGGSLIEFTRKGWHPRRPTNSRDCHEWAVRDDHIELIEHREDGTTHTFQLTPMVGSPDELLVSQRHKAGGKTWTLQRLEGDRKSAMVAGNDFKSSVEKMLQKKRMASVTPQESFLSESGFWVNLTNSSIFQAATLTMIMLNTLWIAVDTDYNRADFLNEAPMVFQVFDNAFCVFFCVELLVRLMSFKGARFALMDGWFVFDLCLVAMMVWETWILVYLHTYFGVGGAKGRAWRGSSVLRIFRVLRLTRVARMVRLLRHMPELLVMIKGLGVAMRSVTCTLGLLTVVMYIFAVLFTQLLGQSDLQGVQVLDGAFDNVPWSMHTLLMQVVCGFDADFITKLLGIGWEFYILFLIYLLLGSLTILNLLVGILVEVVSNVSTEEKERAHNEELETRVTNMVKLLDDDLSGTLTEEEFMDLMQMPQVLQELENLGVDVVAFMDFTKFVFLDTDELALEEFQSLIKQFEGSKVATVKDIVDVNKFITMELRGLEKHLVKRMNMAKIGN